jgi:hypothetical protein
MAKEKFYSVEVLVEKMQKEEIGWLDYVNHYSRKMKREYAQWCADKGKNLCDETAEEFLDLKSEEMEEAMEKGDM